MTAADEQFARMVLRLTSRYIGWSVDGERVHTARPDARATDPYPSCPEHWSGRPQAPRDLCELTP